MAAKRTIPQTKPLSLVEYHNLSFLIFDAPSDATIDRYIAEFKKHAITNIIRCCEITYDKTALNNDLKFADGDTPTPELINNWLMLVENNLSSNIEKKATLGVHCIAGLGRSPLLVAIVLIEAGLNVLDAVIFIREKRRGAINAKQLKFLESYKKRGKGNKIRKMAKDDGGDNVELNGKKSKECMVM